MFELQQRRSWYAFNSKRMGTIATHGGQDKLPANRLPSRQGQKRDAHSTLLATEIAAYLGQLQIVQNRVGFIDSEESDRCQVF